MKQCIVCLQQLTLESFYLDKSKKCGKSSTCKECSKKRTSLWQKNNPERHRANVTRYQRANPEKMQDYNRKYEFGIPLGEYDRMLVEQNGVCAICRQPLMHSRPLDVDHCHITRQIRGLLCWSCNRGLGFFKDNPTYLHNALSYLSKANSVSVSTGS